MPNGRVFNALGTVLVKRHSIRAEAGEGMATHSALTSD
jgi:hypothetical protein